MSQSERKVFKKCDVCGFEGFYISTQDENDYVSIIVCPEGYLCNKCWNKERGIK
jgi:hypothetical protein